MAEFVMLCPACNATIIARTGLFAKKAIKCECGQMVTTEKIVVEVCPKCGGSVEYDRSKTYMPVCPICKHVINVRARITKAMNEYQDKMFSQYTVNLSEITKEDCSCND